VRDYVARSDLGESADRYCGSQAVAADYDVLFAENVRVLSPEGNPVAVLVRGKIPRDVAQAGYEVFRTIREAPRNRFVATIGQRAPKVVRRDGTISKTSFITDAMLKSLGLLDASSAIIGFMDRYARRPFCRKTAFNMDHPELFERAMPFIRRVDEIFAEFMPERRAAQMAKIEATVPDWVIPNTAFTTVTVNRNYPTRYHKDAGDLKEGFGVMSVLRAGHYSGGYFVMPRYRVAFNVGNADVLLADVHQWHGNTRLRGIPNTYERISCVFYYREEMFRCGTADQELVRARGRQIGAPLYD